MVLKEGTVMVYALNDQHKVKVAHVHRHYRSQPVFSRKRNRYAARI